MKNEFRSMRRFKQQLTEDECRTLLQKEARGVLAVNGDNGYPYAFPMNFYFNKKTRTIYLHSAKAGYKLDALVQMLELETDYMAGQQVLEG